jgi:fructose-specific phosphotransferase system IIC component
MMKSLSKQAIFLGGISGFLGGYFVNQLIDFLLSLTMSLLEMPAPVIDATVRSPALESIHLIIKVVSAVCGGFLAAEIAKRRALLYGFLSGWLYLASLAFFLFFRRYDYLGMGFCVVAPIMGILGGYIYRG